jgi:uncharacterized repeat protein (TIGR01451 family)
MLALLAEGDGRLTEQDAREAETMNRTLPRSAFPFLLFILPVGGRVSPSAAQEADLAITKVVDSKNAKIGETMTFTITVTNLGPSTATNVVFGDPVPDPLNLVSFACSEGTVQGQSLCEVGSIASGASVTAMLVATPITNPAQSERKFTNTAFISESGTTDPNADNDSATLDLHIIGKIN